jgi:hypothetical protein
MILNASFFLPPLPLNSLPLPIVSMTVNPCRVFFGSIMAAMSMMTPVPSSSARAAEPLPTFIKSESFDHDPGWEGHNNRIAPKAGVTVKQDFGYSPTHFAGQSPGEMGGRVQRCTIPAMYGDTISKTLDEPLSASGSFAVTSSQGGAGLFFGYFNSGQQGASGRPVGSLGLDFDFEAHGGRLAVRLITSNNQSCGTFITPYLPGKYRPTPIRNDGTRYHWTLNYDPHANQEEGRVTFTLRDDGPPAKPLDTTLPEASQHEARIRYPYTTNFFVDLTPGFRKQNASFDRFGLMNMMKTGGAATIYFDDLQYDGRSQDYSQDPGWVGKGNRDHFEDGEQVGAHDFGYSAGTSFAGGSPGEIGGRLWRSGKYGYYADRVGPLNLEQPLEARGRVILSVAGPDSDMYLGWFSSARKDDPPPLAGDFVGIHVGGPTRVGHYFNPAFATGKGTKGRVKKGPILTPGKVLEWSLVYDPITNNGNGEIRVTLGDESVTLPLRPGQKAEGANLDRFGLMTSNIGGQMVKILFDDLKYTAAGTRR